jgi:NAD(P)-dependent dehydrogenase (short-subunit alcohol dehydrogenase family)
MATSQTNQPRRTLLLTGASRGIGHATVKRFSAAGWRVITCSRHPFPENCPWEAGPEDHIQVDLADEDNTNERLQKSNGGSTTGAARAGQQRRDLAEGPTAASASQRLTPATTTGTTYSK